MKQVQTKKLYTTHDVAKLLGVTPITVIRWIEGGKFKCFTTVGGHRRIDHDELVHFANAYNLPWQGEDELQKRRDFVLLAVDDDEEMLQLIADMILGMNNIKLIPVTNGFTAGAKLVEERPDLILLDFLMPELDGFEFTRFVRQDPRFKDLPLVAVTGLKSEKDKHQMRVSGVNDILTKPFTSEQLKAMIDRYRKPKGSAFPQSSESGTEA